MLGRQLARQRAHSRGFVDCWLAGFGSVQLKPNTSVGVFRVLVRSVSECAVCTVYGVCVVFCIPNPIWPVQRVWSVCVCVEHYSIDSLMNYKIPSVTIKRHCIHFANHFTPCAFYSVIIRYT